MQSASTPPPGTSQASRLGIAAALLALGAGCGALDEFRQTIVDETTIPSTQSALTPFAPAFSGGGFSNVNFSTLQEFQNNGVSPDDVDAIYVESITMAIDAGSNNPAIEQLDNFIVSVEFFVEAPGLERQVVAKKDMMPETASTTLEITPGEMLPGVNLKPYATAESMSFGAQMTITDGRMLTAKLTTTVVLVVDVNLLGV